MQIHFQRINTNHNYITFWRTFQGKYLLVQLLKFACSNSKLSSNKTDFIDQECHCYNFSGYTTFRHVKYYKKYFLLSPWIELAIEWVLPMNSDQNFFSSGIRCPCLIQTIGDFSIRRVGFFVSICCSNF